jgi:hypothetical protein
VFPVKRKEYMSNHGPKEPNNKLVLQVLLNLFPLSLYINLVKPSTDSLKRLLLH